MRRRIRALDLALLGHREIFKDCLERIDELRSHHQQRLSEIRSILEGGGKMPMKWHHG